MAESVRVIVRCRPLNQREIRLNSTICVDMDAAIGQCQLNTSAEGSLKSFSFDGVYSIDSTTEQIYNDIVYPLVENVIEGYNGTVFAYGQTGSGKTFSMQGDDRYPAQRGIIPRTFEHIFEAISTTENTKFLVHVSYLEIYNEEIRDLLGKDRERKLEVKEHPEQGIYVAHLSMHICHNVADCERLMNEGFSNRHVGATLMNKDSSRSHSIFTIYVEALCDNGLIRMGKLHLVDLAGSERQAKTGATGDRFKEATKINLSLSALGNVISALVDGKSKHIPYRDSKLTRLLQDSLGGNTKTVMVACISPSDNNFDETLSTLRYANRAKNIKNKPKINEDPKDALLREYQEEIDRLRKLIQQPNGVQHQSNVLEFESEKRKLKAEFEQAMNELRTSYEREQKSKEKLQTDLERLKEHYDRASEEIEIAHKTEEKSLDKKEAKKRIELLEHQLVGGEQADNEVLKQKRWKRMREAERKMQRLVAALNAHKDDPLLHAYTSTQEKLEALEKQYNSAKKRVVTFETEVRDLQGEFEADRLDYLETIRKQDQQLKLFQKILERVQPAIRRDCNYANLDQVQKEAVWDENSGCWVLPEMTTTLRQGLPAAGQVSPSARPELRNGIDDHIFGDIDESESKLKKRLDQSMDNDFINNYFKRVSRTNILDKYNVDKHRAVVEEKIANYKRRYQKMEAFLKGVVYTEEVYGNGQAQANGQQNNANQPNAGDDKWWNGNTTNNSNGHTSLTQPNSLLTVGDTNRNLLTTASGNRANSAARKPPQRLEALQVVRNKSFT